VSGIDAPVHDTRGLDRGQAVRQPRRQGQHRTQGPERPVLADRVGQRRPVHERRRQPRHVAVQVRVEHGNDKGSAHLARGGDLGPEPGIRGQFGPDDLYRDVAPALGTAVEHLPRVVVAKLLEQPVRPDRARLVKRKWRQHPDPRSEFLRKFALGKEPAYSRAPAAREGGSQSEPACITLSSWQLEPFLPVVSGYRS